MNYIIRRINWDNLDAVGIGVLCLVAAIWTFLIILTIAAVDFTLHASSWGILGLVFLIFMALALAFLTYEMIREKFLK